jgi:hypothetical protein
MTMLTTENNTASLELRRPLGRIKGNLFVKMRKQTDAVRSRKFEVLASP